MIRMTSFLAAIAVVGFFAISEPQAASATTFELVIHHAELEDTGISPKVGDTITFINDADISHNLYLTYEDGHVETLDTQIPKTKKSVVLRQPGKVVVRCWIHPVIRMEMTVGAN